MSHDSAGGTPIMVWARIAVVVIAAVILLVFVLQNSGHVEIQFIFGSLETRLVWALLLAAGLGFLIGWLVPRLRRGRDRE